MGETKRTIYIDCTATQYLQINTGIQRVVRSLISRISLVEERLGIECVPVVAEFGRFWRTELKTNRPSRVGKTKKDALSRFGTTVSIQLDKAEDYALSLRNRLLASSLTTLVKVVRRAIRNTGYFVIKAPQLLRTLVNPSRSVEFEQGDILLLPDSFWAYNISSAVGRIDASRTAVVPLVHDLIPVYYPEYCSDDFIQTFKTELNKIAQQAAGYITVSNTTRGDLLKYLDEAGPPIDPHLVHTCYLGSEIGDAAHAEQASPIRPQIDAIFDRENNVYLMVGTIEPRKGHEFVYRALINAWEAGSTDRLLICGRVGWMCKDLITELKQSPYLNSRLFVFHDANDAELQHAYQHASALVFASEVEGFGLPLVEALAHGLPVVATDIPIFREIGGDGPEFFQRGNSAQFTAALSTISSQSNATAAPPEVVRSWDEAATDMLSTAIHLAEQSHAPK